jgi:hypothetical protein
MSDKLKIDIAAETIRLAFADVPYPGDDMIAVHQDYELSDGWNCAKILRGKHWRDISPASLRKCDYPFLTPQSFWFYLPAYLLGKLLHPDEIDFTGDSIVYGLKPPFSPFMAERVALLNAKQKSSIRAFLEAISMNPDDIHEDAKAALEGYWNQFS